MTYDPHLRQPTGKIVKIESFPLDRLVEKGRILAVSLGGPIALHYKSPTGDHSTECEYLGFRYFDHWQRTQESMLGDTAFHIN